MENKNRRIFSSNSFERRIFNVVIASAIIPFFITMAFLFFIFHDLIAFYLHTEAASRFLQSFFSLACILFLYYSVFIGLISYFFIHRLLGAFPRILNELDDRITGKTRGPINLRKSDYGKELVERINTLIGKIEKIRDIV